MGFGNLTDYEKKLLEKAKDELNGNIKSGLTFAKQYLSKTHTRRREWLSNNADLNLYGILQELPFMAGKEFVSFFLIRI